MKNIILVGIDGTISDPSHRKHHLENNTWKQFYSECDQDTSYQDIITLVQMFCRIDGPYQIVFCTGRVESVREKTIDWITRYMYMPRGTYTLLMRKDGDYRHETDVKPELLEKAGIQYHEIFMVFEDRNSMVKKWRELGIRCLQVQEGDF